MATKDDVGQIDRHESSEPVLGIVAHELKRLREQVRQDIEGINDRLVALEGRPRVGGMALRDMEVPFSAMRRS